MDKPELPVRPGWKRLNSGQLDILVMQQVDGPYRVIGAPVGDDWTWTVGVRYPTHGTDRWDREYATAEEAMEAAEKKAAG